MGSFAGAAPTPMLAVYSGSKAFLRTWSDALAAELGPKGVLVEHVNTYYVVRPPSCPTSLPSPAPPTSARVGYRRQLLTNVTFIYFSTPSADLGNVKNPPPVALRSHPKVVRARRARQARAGHHHAVLDPRALWRRHGTRAVQAGSGVHALAFEGYQEARPGKTGKACQARIGT